MKTWGNGISIILILALFCSPVLGISKSEMISSYKGQSIPTPPSQLPSWFDQYPDVSPIPLIPKWATAAALPFEPFDLGEMFHWQDGDTGYVDPPVLPEPTPIIPSWVSPMSGFMILDPNGAPADMPVTCASCENWTPSPGVQPYIRPESAPIPIAGDPNSYGGEPEIPATGGVMAYIAPGSGIPIFVTPEPLPVLPYGITFPTLYF